MRVLFTTRGSAGHFLPLVPFAHACRRAGHEVRVAAQSHNGAVVERAGLPFAPVSAPPPEQWGPLMARFSQLGLEESNAMMISEFFAGVDARASLPDLRALVEDFRPDVIVRESWEFASPLVAELYGIPLLRVGLGLAGVEQRGIALVAAVVDRHRAELGLPRDPDGARLAATPYFTTVPALLDDPQASAAGGTHRFAAADDAGASAPPPLREWWPENDDPLVLLSLGSVAAGEHMPYFPAVYQAAIDALAPLRARILVTIGNERDPAQLGALPANVHVERWVAQDAVAPHLAAMVCHGGFGSTLGALRHGVPLVVMPLFSSDQWANAAAVARTGAGIALDRDYATRGALGLPPGDVMAQLAPAVQRLLSEPSYRATAARIGAAARALAPVDHAVEVLRGYATYTGVPTGARA